MSNDRDMVLQNLFKEADEQLDDSAFTGQVVKRTYGLIIRLGSLAAFTALVVLAGMLAFDYSPLLVVQGITEVMTTPVFVMEGWAGWFLTPVNNIAGVLILGFKGFRLLYKKGLCGSKFS